MADSTSVSPAAEAAPPREPMSMASTGPCWICGGTHMDPVWKANFDLSDFPRFGAALAHNEHPTVHLVRCRDCGFGQPDLMPVRSDYFDILYDIPWTDQDLAFQFDHPYKDWVFERLIEDLKRRVPADLPRTLLDVGCNIGKFLSMASRAGWQVEGAEMAQRTADFAAGRTGLTIHRGPAQEIAALGKKYAAITLIDVLEHIPRPAPVVVQLQEMLLPGGVLVIKVPHGPMQRLKEKFRGKVLGRRDAGVMTRLVHVNHFTVAALRNVMESAGLKDVTVTVGAPELPSRGMTPTPKESVSALGRKSVYHLARALPGGVHTPLSLNLIAYGRKPR